MQLWSSLCIMIEAGAISARPVMAPFWLVAWSVTLSTAWLLPNHYLPWTGFHFDLWVACVLSMASATVILRSPGTTHWHASAAFAGVLVLVPSLQQAVGMMVFSGNTWVCSAYLLALLLVLLTGAKWESTSPGQLADGLFLAIGLAAISSVGLQLHQWLRFDSLDVWIMADNFGRPFANFGQPNQLATFLLWGLLALAWGLVRRHITCASALFVAAYLLFGLALTRSRTAWLAAILLVVVVWVWRRHWSTPRVPFVVTGLALYFALCVASLGSLHQALLLAEHKDLLDPTRMSTETRPTIWLMFLNAALERPWLGYGWNQVALAQVNVALDHPGLNSTFSQAHNLFLDLILWCGIPSGLIVSFGLLRWSWLRFRAVRNAEDAILVLFLLVVANHAMFELPLHYAYMLLPVGLVAGALNVRLGAGPLLRTGRWPMMAIWVVSLVLLAVIVRDYSRVEPTYRQLRFEWANIKGPPVEPPDVLVLTQLREYVRLAKFEPKSEMSEAELEWMRGVAGIYPGAGPFQKMATALALNGRTDEARLWLQRLCKITPEIQCALAKRVWHRMSEQDSRIASVPWPK